MSARTLAVAIVLAVTPAFAEPEPIVVRVEAVDMSAALYTRTNDKLTYQCTAPCESRFSAPSAVIRTDGIDQNFRIPFHHGVANVLVTRKRSSTVLVVLGAFLLVGAAVNGVAWGVAMGGAKDDLERSLMAIPLALTEVLLGGAGLALTFTGLVMKPLKIEVF